MFTLINYSTPAEKIVRHVQSADAGEMEELVSALTAEIVALNAPITNPDDQWTPADANLAGAGDGHTFIYTATFVPRRLNFILTNLVAFGAGLWPTQTVQLNPGPGNVVVPTYPTPFPPAVLIVPGPEQYLTKFCLAGEREELTEVFDAMIAKALAEANQNTSLALWQQIAGAAKGTRFMGGVSLLLLPQVT